MVWLELVLLCLALWGLCFLGTGGDEKNIRFLSSYPDAVIERVKGLPKYQDQIPQTNMMKNFPGNLVVFLVVLGVGAFQLRAKSFGTNVLTLMILGQGLNVFDLVVIDLLWWRHTKRVRFTEVPEEALYQDPTKHIQAFERAVVMYTLVALIDGFVLTLF